MQPANLWVATAWVLALCGCQPAPQPDQAASAPAAIAVGAKVTKFQFTDGGTRGSIEVRPDGTATYRDAYCKGMVNTTGKVQGDSIRFDRMTYPSCGKPEPLWADIEVSGYNPANGCFAQVSFTWGYDFVKRYTAYPTDPACKG